CRPPTSCWRRPASGSVMSAPGRRARSPPTRRSTTGSSRASRRCSRAGRVAYVNVRRTQIARARERILALQERAKLAFAALLQNRDARLERAERLLAAVSYRG